MDYAFTVLASGSRGNCCLLRGPQGAVLIDAGINGRQLESRLAELGLGLEAIDAVVLTHEHGDHCAGVPALLRRGKCVFYANSATWRAVEADAGERWSAWERGTVLELAGMRFDSFPVPHDAADPIGLVIEAGAQRLGVVTDLGYATQVVVDRLRGCSLLVLETNYDPDLLRADVKRPWSVKQRIANRHGHLSNQAAADLLERAADQALRHLVLFHLSEDCNRPELAEEVMRARLERMGLNGVRIHRTCYERISETIGWSSCCSEVVDAR